MAGVDRLLVHNRYRKNLGADQILYQLLVPVLSMCLTLEIGQNEMRHHIPWGNRWDLMCSPCAMWSKIISYLHVNEGWQLSDFSNYLGRQGTIKACLHFSHFLEGRPIHLLLKFSLLIGLKTRILDLSPRLFWPSEKLSCESSSISTTISGSRTVLVGRRFIFPYIGHLE